MAIANESQKKREGNSEPAHHIGAHFAPGNPWRFEPGNCANPGGRPKGRTIEAELRAMLDKNDSKLLKAMAQKAIERAINGDPKFWNAVVERVYGKVMDRIAVAGADELLKVVGDIDVAAVCGRMKRELATGGDSGNGPE